MIIVKNLVKKFGDRVIVRDFSYHFPKNACIGVVGANGAGKTTFLNILTSLEECDSGEVIVPKDCVMCYLPQSPNENPKDTLLEECISGHLKLYILRKQLHLVLKKMEESYSDEVYSEYEKTEKEFADNDGYALESEAKGILVGLGFENSQFETNPKTLSGGWRMRLELAKLLINNPTFLILDEPTNHLDLPSLTWLEGYLKSFKGTLLFVSHDRDFLNNLSDKILHILNGNINIYNGNFDDFIEEREVKTELIKKQKETLKQKQDHLQAFVDRFRSKASKARQAQSKLKMIKRLKDLEGNLEAEKLEKMPNFKIEILKSSGKIVLDIKQATLGYDVPLIKNLNLQIFRGNKIAIIGANGIGKSTLLKTIINEIPLLTGNLQFGPGVSIGYLSQNQEDVLDPKLNPLENVLKLTGNITSQQARAILSYLLITKDSIYKPVSVLSGGEKSKVAIAALLAQKN
ncbi:MAG: ATP-binding cassette domain-containing protein, partial [Holosporales bacterium]|nr:ATP-binding cassette domain-containing protein [Holosporales bacterium]